MAQGCHSFKQEVWSRAAALRRPDVVIIGGGVNGVAVLRELALNNLTAVLIEQGDFCQGASGASTRMAHGGLRYLEQREFALVAEASRERNLLMKYASHATVPLQVVLPVEHVITGFFRSMLNFLGLGQRRAPLNLLSAKLALIIYERLGCPRRSLFRHATKLGRQSLPSHLDRRFKGHVSYQDGRLRNPEGLVFEMLEEALANSNQVTALNHVDWQMSDDGMLRATDATGDNSLSLRPRLVVNATGAWLDRTNARLGITTDYVSAIRGAHIVVHHEELFRRLQQCAFYFDDGAGRMVICCPLDRTVLMGTTEIPCSNFDERFVAVEEVDYLRGALSGLFDDIDVGDEHIIAVTTGARPLQKSEGDAYAASRGHVVRMDRASHHAYPVLSMIGGKWTTFRAFAEGLTDHALMVLDTPRIVSTRSRTYRGTPMSCMAGSFAKDAISARLFDHYGAVAAEVRDFCDQAADQELRSVPGYTRREIMWLIRHRGAVFLDDILLRRTTIALDGLATDEAISEIAHILGDVTERPNSWVEGEIRRCRTLSAIRWQTTGPHRIDLTTRDDETFERVS